MAGLSNEVSMYLSFPALHSWTAHNKNIPLPDIVSCIWSALKNTQEVLGMCVKLKFPYKRHAFLTAFYCVFIMFLMRKWTSSCQSYDYNDCNNYNMKPQSQACKKLFPHSGHLQIGMRAKKSTKQGALAAICLHPECGKSSSDGSSAFYSGYNHRDGYHMSSYLYW